MGGDCQDATGVVSPSAASPTAPCDATRAARPPNPPQCVASPPKRPPPPNPAKRLRPCWTAARTAPPWSRGWPPNSRPSATAAGRTAWCAPRVLACPTGASACSWWRRCTATRATCCWRRSVLGFALLKEALFGFGLAWRGEGRGRKAMRGLAPSKPRLHLARAAPAQLSPKHPSTKPPPSKGRPPLHGRVPALLRRGLLGVLRPRRRQGGGSQRL